MSVGADKAEPSQDSGFSGDGSAPHQPLVGAGLPRPSVSHDPSLPELPPEIAFLASYGISSAILLKAAQAAARSGITADLALLAEDMLSQEVFYRLLARHLGLAFGDQDLPLAPQNRYPMSIVTGIVPLSPNDQNIDYVMAPRGAALIRLLTLCKLTPVSRLRCAITSPERLSFLVQTHFAHKIQIDAVSSLRRNDPSMSAASGWIAGQCRFCIACITLIGTAFCINADIASVAVTLPCALLFVIAITVRLFAAAESGSAPQRSARLADSDLPVYSIVAPLYREARVVRKLVAALNALDYPRGKLDIKFVVEADDAATIDALMSLSLPARYEIIVAPPGEPRTKPRALNMALPLASGSLLVVYDAEDEPDPDQLRLAAARFASGPRRLACLQAHLAIDNTQDNWITRQFTIEYAALFDVLNPGLASLGLPILLGGTSNHFRVDILRDVCGWDAWNVTEDADLGIRLARYGYRVETLASTTLEEAPNAISAWLGQRRRWIKGWMQTLAVHARSPRATASEMGLLAAITVFANLSSFIISALVGPFLCAILVYRAWAGNLLAPATISEIAWSTLSVFVFLTGLANLVWLALLGLKRRGLLAVSGSLLVLPAYLLLLTAAAWLALFDFFQRRFEWTKTEHGLATSSRRGNSTASEAVSRGAAAAARD